ncbi:MAG TPA: tetratricopeptide repeat protein [Kofleriaceae bacterium]
MLALVASFAAVRTASADPRDDARAHYQSGLKLYNAGDYKSAITEFTAAQQLAPADLNSYNLGLCYDKLGDADSAVKYYREYLNKVPDAPKRAEIEASISRLNAASKSISKKNADAKADADAKAAADAAAAAATAPKTAPTGLAEQAPTEATPPPDLSASGGSTGTPGTGQAVQTGDAQLDRVAGINIDQVRDQRFGANPGAAGAVAPGPNGPPPPGAPNAAVNPQNTSLNGAPPEAPKETPIYKKWWFWAVVAVSAYVVYEIATSSSNSSNNTGREAPLNGTMMTNRSLAAPQSGGYTLLHF